jgi:hypothetical protein
VRPGFVAVAVLAAAAVAGAPRAAPLGTEEITRLCTDAEGPAHCARKVEAEQMRRLPGIATRDGNSLRVALYPTGAATFTDIDTLSGGTAYALWDFLSEINATVLWVTRDDDAGFLIVQRPTNRQTPLPAEPVLAPDRQRIVTADFCAKRCENLLTVWTVTRDGIARELQWAPKERWSDAGVRWKGPEMLVVEYTPEGSESPKMLERKLTDPGWTRVTGK